MGTPNDVYLDEVRTFYDPHPGFAGASVPLPAPIKAIADDLDGERMSLRSAIARLERAEIGRFEVVSRFECIMMRMGGGSGPEHVFRVIRYR